MHANYIHTVLLIWSQTLYFYLIVWRVRAESLLGVYKKKCVFVYTHFFELAFPIISFLFLLQLSYDTRTWLTYKTLHKWFLKVKSLFFTFSWSIFMLREVTDELFERITMVMRLKAQLLAAILFKLKAFYRQGLSSFSLFHVSCLSHRRLLVNIFGERHAYAGVFIQKS